MALALDEADEAKVVMANVDEGLAIRRQYLRLTITEATERSFLPPVFPRLPSFI